MCLGPGTEIQGTGSLFFRKIGPPICWDFFADLGGGLQGPQKADHLLGELFKYPTQSVCAARAVHVLPPCVTVVLLSAVRGQGVHCLF